MQHSVIVSFKNEKRINIWYKSNQNDRKNQLIELKYETFLSFVKRQKHLQKIIHPKQPTQHLKTKSLFVKHKPFKHFFLRLHFSKYNTQFNYKNIWTGKIFYSWSYLWVCVELISQDDIWIKIIIKSKSSKWSK